MSKSKRFFVLGLSLYNGYVEPHYWTDKKPSKRTIKRVYRPFKKEKDVLSGVAMPWQRLYNTVREMKAILPRY